MQLTLVWSEDSGPAVNEPSNFKEEGRMNGKRSWAVVAFLVICLGVLCAANAWLKPEVLPKTPLKLVISLSRRGR